MFADICNMHILLVGATHSELDAIESAISPKENLKKHLSMAVTGVGLVSTTYSLLKIVSREKPDLILQAGIAGCFKMNQEGSVVVVRDEVVADMGVLESDEFRDVFDLGLADKHDMPYTNGHLPNPYQKLIKYSALPAVNGISINEITTEPDRIRSYQQRFDPFVESMEGAALHYVCIEERIPFLQLRAISNFVGERDKSKWQMKAALGALQTEIIGLIEKLLLEDENFFGF
ncbi:MAG: futalosine hydrolase [Bacteroidetes bacterium]|nr:MAG: futalosine hydrolase [Bacteroidota bacterium]